MVQVPLKDYGYANARVRAMSARLLDSDTFEELLSAQDFGRALNILDNTEYGPDIEETILLGLRPTNIDRALNLNMARNLSKIRDFFIGRPEELLKALLSHWDLYNLKTILRGKKALIPNAEISRNLMPMGALDLIVLEEIIKQPDLRAALDAIVMFSSQWWIPYGRAITPAMKEFFRDRDLAVLELSLDKFHYDQVTEIISGGNQNAALVRHVVEMNVDAININTLIRIGGLDVEEARAESYFIRGGTITVDEFIEFFSLGRMDKIAEALMAKTSYKDALQRALERIDKEGETAFKDEMEKYIMRECLNISEDPLGIGIIIKYMWRKFLEVLNLRIIIRGKSIGLIESQIREELVVVD